MTFFFVWQAEFGMCFGVAPSVYRSVHATLIFQSFEPSPWRVASWKWLLEKHPIARQTFFAIVYRPRPNEQLTVLNLLGPIFTLLVTQVHVKIVVIEPAKPISARCFR